ncbi:MAG: hypothetical protein Q9199_006755, partial [Rusavskia elegans]
ITRISESLAKLTLTSLVTESHVDEAIRLFLASTMHAATATGGSSSSNLNSNADLQAETQKVEEELRRRLPVGWSTALRQLKKEFVDGRGYSEQSLSRALGVLQRREVVQMRKGGSVVFRVAN